MNVSTTISTRDKAAIEKRLRLSVAARNFAGMPTRGCLERIAAIGFDTVDNFNWRDPAEFRIYQETLPSLSLGAGVLVVNKVPDVNALGCSLTLEADREGFLRELQACAAAAETVNCDRLEVLSGNVVDGLSRVEQMDSCVRTLRAAEPLLQRHGMMLVVEMLNSTQEHPGYFLDTVRDSLALIDRVGSNRVRLLFDIYHVQLGEGNIIRKLREHIRYIGQIHFADAPGRHEPGTGEINFRNVFKAIYDLGDRYTGYVTAEYHPTDTTFGDLKFTKQLATFG
jgi:hydroxypyruvate isomerase